VETVEGVMAVQGEQPMHLTVLMGLVAAVAVQAVVQ
jgi:hypothetical protein